MKRSFLLAVAFFTVMTYPVLAQQSQGQGGPASSSAGDEIKKLPPLPFKEESVGDFSGPGFNVKGAFSGTPVTIDAAFATKYENPAPPKAPFTVVVPKNKEVLFIPGGKASGAPELVKFATATADKRAIEILRFINLSIGLQPDPADRLKICAHFLKTEVLASASKGYEKVTFLEAYATKIGGNDAACVHAHMTSAKGEHYAVKLVGILRPKEPDGVLAFLMADTELSDVKNPPDLASKGTGLAIIHSLRFIDPPKTKGQ